MHVMTTIVELVEAHSNNKNHKCIKNQWQTALNKTLSSMFHFHCSIKFVLYDCFSLKGRKLLEKAMKAICWNLKLNIQSAQFQLVLMASLLSSWVLKGNRKFSTSFGLTKSNLNWVQLNVMCNSLNRSGKISTTIKTTTEFAKQIVFYGLLNLLSTEKFL